LHMKAASADVYIVDEPFPNVGRQELEFLKSRIHESTRGRVRLCAHKSNNDELHEMFIAFSDRSYIRPSRHLGKDESLHVLEGSGDYLFFDEAGEVTDVVSLGEYSSGFQFYCRIPESANHALVLNSDYMIIHEITSGPFNRADTVFASWSPQEGDASAASYVGRIKTARIEGKLLQMKRRNAEVYIADEPIIRVGRKEIDFLKSKLSESEPKTIRLCAQKDAATGLREMFVVYTSQTYVKPNKRTSTDESLHILQGDADFYFFDEKGNITDVIPLGDYNSGRQFYIRVPASVWHTIVVRSDTLASHESSTGPLQAEDKVWAHWAPEETDVAEVRKFLDRLTAATKEAR